MDYEKYRDKVDFIKQYSKAINASSGSEVDANANVENKNIATCANELPKKDIIGINRLMMCDMLTKLYGEDMAHEYVRQLDNHAIYVNDETSVFSYCSSITMYPFLFDGLKNIGGISSAPKNLQSFNGSFINLVFAVASQFAGAVATPEYLTYMDYFVRKEYGDDYYLNPDKIVVLGLHPKSIDKVITDSFEQVVYSMNQPAAARGYQAVFWNIAYFDHPYFNGIFEDFVFPDGTAPKWDSVNWLQKRFMKWFNRERLRSVLTFPVETMNLLDDGHDFVDKEYKDFQAEMYAEGHSFFTYRSDTVDSLASCCFDGSQPILIKESNNGVHLISFKEFYDSKWNEMKNDYSVFHNGNWVKASAIRLPKKQLYKVVTANNKELLMTEDHISVTDSGEKATSELTTNDYLMFSTKASEAIRENDLKLTYEEGVLIGAYLGDGVVYNESESYNPTISLSLNSKKYKALIPSINRAVKQLGETNEFSFHEIYNNYYPIILRSKIVMSFIRNYVYGNYSYEKELNLNCLLQSEEFREGIIDGFCTIDGGNNSCIYSSSRKLIDEMEALFTSLGIVTVITESEQRDEAAVIRGQEYNGNLYSLRWYGKYKRTFRDLYRWVNNSIFFKIKSIEPYESNDHYVYCFEMKNSEEPYFTLPNGVITHNCRLRNEINENTFSYTLGAGGVSTGSKKVITINLNRLVQDATKNGVDISDAVREQIAKCHKYLIAFNEILKVHLKNHMLPVYDAGYISMEKQYLTIGVNGFIEGAESLGIEIGVNDKYFEYGEKILKPIYEMNRAARTKEIMFNCEMIPAENLGVKNAKWDKRDGYFSPRDCYNSYFYKVEDPTCSVIDKFILHGNRLTRYLDGGSALHCNLDEHLTKEQYIKLGEVAIKSGCSYYTFNIPNTICNDCGFISKHRLQKCPKCGSENLDYATRVIGYLKRISRFSEARIKEAGKRFYADFKN